MKNLTDGIQKGYPALFKAVFPRNISVPHGYADPRHYSSSMVGFLETVRNPLTTHPVHVTGYMMAISLMATKVPTYFVAPEFAYSVANTDLPGDFKFAELKWPLQAQLFVLPDEFISSYFEGIYCPFMSIAHVFPGNYPTDLKLPINLDTPPLPVKDEKIVMDYPVFHLHETPTDYNGSYPVGMGVEVFKTGPFNDMTPYEEKVHNIKFKADPITPEQEKKFIDRACQFLIKLLLAVAERPNLVEHGAITRHARVHQGRVVLPQIVSPNFIGRTYRIPRRYAEGVAAGSGRKPRFVFRRGHYTWQAKRFKDAEFISVSQMPRKDDGIIDFDAAGESLSNKFRACHERLWIEGFLFGDQDLTEKVK